jgi:hypothetical protein
VVVCSSPDEAELMDSIPGALAIGSVISGSGEVVVA